MHFVVSAPTVFDDSRTSRHVLDFRANACTESPSMIRSFTLAGAASLCLLFTGAQAARAQGFGFQYNQWTAPARGGWGIGVTVGQGPFWPGYAPFPVYPAWGYPYLCPPHVPPYPVPVAVPVPYPRPVPYPWGYGPWPGRPRRPW